MSAINKLKPIYYYDPIYHYYTGDGFAQEGEGIFLPDFCTTIQPPHCSTDSIQKFNKETTSWEIIKAPSDCNELINHHAIYEFNKTHSSTDKPQIYKITAPNHLGDPGISELSNFLQPINKITRFISHAHVACSLAQRIVYTNKKIEELYSDHKKTEEFCKKTGFLAPQSFTFQPFDIANIIHNIKRILDVITISVYLRNKKDISLLTNNDEIKCDAIGFLMKQNKENSDTRNALHFTFYEDLLTTINDAHNAYKHSILTECLPTTYYPEPTVCIRKTLSPKFKNFKVILSYEIELNKIIFATNDLLSILFKNKDITTAPIFKLESKSNHVISTSEFH